MLPQCLDLLRKVGYTKIQPKIMKNCTRCTYDRFLAYSASLLALLSCPESFYKARVLTHYKSANLQMYIAESEISKPDQIPLLLLKKKQL